MSTAVFGGVLPTAVAGVGALATGVEELR